MPDAKFCKYCAFDLSRSVSTKPEPVIATHNRSYSSAGQLTSGIDSLLADRYRSMSDSELLATSKGDLSTHTEKTLSMALTELETRKSLDWRDAEIAKSRLKEAINCADSYASYVGSPRDRSSMSQREKADKLMKSGGITAAVSALLFLWGYNYTSSFVNSARASLMNITGQTDSTYQFASLCVVLGAMGFLVGVILVIVGVAQKPS